MDSVEVDMNYEFFFLRNVGLENPTVLREMAPSYHEAIALVARRYGCTSLAGNWQGMKEFVHSRHIHAVEVERISLKKAREGSHDGPAPISHCQQFRRVFHCDSFHSQGELR